MPKLRRKNQQGFTLIELLIYLALLAILVFVLTDMLVTLVTSRLESDSSASVDQDARFILTRFAYDIPRASSITDPPALGASSSALTMVINSVTYTYSASTSALLLTNDMGTNNIESSETSMSNLNFLRLGNYGGKDTIKITFTLTGKTIRESGHGDTKNFQTVIGIR